VKKLLSIIGIITRHSTKHIIMANLKYNYLPQVGSIN